MQSLPAPTLETPFMPGFEPAVKTASKYRQAAADIGQHRLDTSGELPGNQPAQTLPAGGEVRQDVREFPEPSEISDFPPGNPAARQIARHLKDSLRGKFPDLRLGFNAPARAAHFWPLGLSAKNPAWPDRLAQGMLTEVICTGPNTGGAGLIHALLKRAAAENQVTAVLDGADSLDVCALGEAALARLLWVRCRDVPEALKAADLILRDNNFSLVIVDLKLNPEAQLRKIPAATWYRLQHLVGETSTVCLIFTPRLLVGATRHRLILQNAAVSPFNP